MGGGIVPCCLPLVLLRNQRESSEFLGIAQWESLKDCQAFWRSPHPRDPGRIDQRRGHPAARGWAHAAIIAHAYQHQPGAWRQTHGARQGHCDRRERAHPSGPGCGRRAKRESPALRLSQCVVRDWLYEPDRRRHPVRIASLTCPATRRWTRSPMMFCASARCMWDGPSLQQVLGRSRTITRKISQNKTDSFSDAG